jgi:hypothetical protein
MWKTGEYIAPDACRPAGQFSFDNYADYLQVEHSKSTGTSKGRKIRVCRATQHVATVKSLSRETWNIIFAEASGYIGKGKKRKRSQSASLRASSERIEDLIEEEADYADVVLESD